MCLVSYHLNSTLFIKGFKNNQSWSKVLYIKKKNNNTVTQQ